MLEFCQHACSHKVTISILYLSHYKVVFIGIKKKLAGLFTNKDCSIEIDLPGICHSRTQAVVYCSCTIACLFTL